MIAITISLVSSILTVLYLWIKHCHSYWQRMNVPYIKPNLIFGNFKEMLTLSCNSAALFQSLCDHKETKNEPIVGIYVMNRAGLLIREPELIKSILITDFNKFSDRSSATDLHGDVIGSNNILHTKNPDWKELRSMLSPFFTAAKLKQMFSAIHQVGKEFDQYCKALPFDTKTNSCSVEIREITAPYMTDLISSVALGVQANSLKNSKSGFRQSGKLMSQYSVMRAIEYYCIIFLPQFVRFLRCKFFSKEASAFFRKCFSAIIEERMASGKHRNDLIDMLIAFKKSVEADDHKNRKHLTHMDVLVAQAAIFFSAGHETASSAMSYALYELAKNPQVQKRLRKEIKEALMKNNNEITYEMLNDMEYLEMVIHEVLRLYPSAVILIRECTLAKDDEDYSLEPYSEYKVPNKLPVYIPVYAIHMDPKNFPNPKQFDPERFSKQNKENIKPMTYFPFGAGPRGCIGKRLGYIQVKVGLIHFLQNHYVTTCEKTRKQMIFDPKAHFLRPKNGNYCNIVRDPLI